jgi:hypothetical protein
MIIDLRRTPREMEPLRDAREKSRSRTMVRLPQELQFNGALGSKETERIRSHRWWCSTG